MSEITWQINVVIITEDIVNKVTSVDSYILETFSKPILKEENMIKTRLIYNNVTAIKVILFILLY